MNVKECYAAKGLYAPQIESRWTDYLIDLPNDSDKELLGMILEGSKALGYLINFSTDRSAAQSLAFKALDDFLQFTKAAVLKEE